MGLLWENLAKQLESVRATAPAVSADAGVSREARLKAALKAVENSGNTMMIESLKAALEGREAKMELPPVASGPAAFLETLKGQSAKG